MDIYMDELDGWIDGYNEWMNELMDKWTSLDEFDRWILMDWWMDEFDEWMDGYQVSGWIWWMDTDNGLTDEFNFIEGIKGLIKRHEWLLLYK